MPIKRKKQRVFNIYKYLKPYWWLCFLGPFTKSVEAATEVVIPMLMAKIIDIGIATQDMPYIYKMASIILGLNFIAIIFAVISQKSSTLVGEGIAKSIRKDMYAHINTFSHAELDGFTPASLLNRTINDVNQVKNVISSTLRLVTRVPLLLIGSAIMAMLIDLQMSVIFLVVIPIITFTMVFLTRKTFPYYENFKIELDKLSNVTRENLSGVRVVRAFNKEKHETERFTNLSTKLLNIDKKVVKITAILQPIIFMVINFSVLAIVYWGGVRVNIGDISTGNVIAFINYFTQISGALITVSRMVIMYTRVSAANKRINEVFLVKNSIRDPKIPVEFDMRKRGAKIEFTNVNFSYGASRDAIKNLSFVLYPGETLGIIGGTGSGKSTIINLIPRLYDVKYGEVKIDDINVKDYQLSQLRNLVGLVPQNIVLFEGTIESNLKWRKEDATEEEMIKALRIAQAYDFVKEKPKFLKEKVNRGGKNFSGGQCQRLTIARALIGSPKILI